MTARARQVEFLISGLTTNSGKPASGLQGGFFEPNSTNLKPIWQDAEQQIPHDNPFFLNQKGTANIYANGVYDFKVLDSKGNVVEIFRSQDYSTLFSAASTSKVDASTFGTGNNADAIQQAMDSLSGADGTVFLRPQAWDIDQNLTIPSNILLEYLYGAFTEVQPTFTLNASAGKFDAPLFNILRGGGAVILPANQIIIPSIWLQTPIDGESTYQGDVTFTDNITVQGTAIFGSISVVDATIQNNLTVNNNLNVDVDLAVGNDATVDNDLTVNGLTNLNELLTIETLGDLKLILQRPTQVVLGDKNILGFFFIGSGIPLPYFRLEVEVTQIASFDPESKCTFFSGASAIVEFEETETAFFSDLLVPKLTVNTDLVLNNEVGITSSNDLQDIASVPIKDAIIEIGSWDMDSDNTKTVFIPNFDSTVTIYASSLTIFDDNGEQVSGNKALANGLSGVWIQDFAKAANQIILQRDAAGVFDNALFDDGGIQRGFIWLKYSKP